MKRFSMIITMLLMVMGNAFAQKGIYSKITPELQEALDSRTADEEQFHIIIMMAEQYDQIFDDSADSVYE